MKTRHIAVFLFDGVEELDAVGPFEVLAYWAQEVAPDGEWAIDTVSATGGLVTGAHGLRIGADFSVESMPVPEVLVHPGGRGTRPLLRDAGHLRWLTELRQDVGLLTSVCTGALPFAAAGLLRNRPATTHWQALDELAALDPSITIRPDDRFVDDGDVITSAGVSAGIDMALHLVARLAGDDVSAQVRRGIQY
ncbi:MAG: DJ-1/PfpI family protein [Actinomycetota bacterium]|nr:DJ-1/PfpI family protein [Actinomycetota bacterium]MDQ2958877.1 DJ-1/PfpI family protein [Actinomycetota bacterium]